MFWFLCVMVVILLVLLILDILNRDEDFEKIPGPKGLPIFGNSFDYMIDPVKCHDIMRLFTNTYKRLFKFKFGLFKVLIMYHPEDVEVLFSGTQYNRKGYLYKFIEPWLQNGLLLSYGAQWQHRRKILTPSFHFNILRNFYIVMEDNSQKLVKDLRAEVGKSSTNIMPFTSDYTLNSICETAMGLKLDSENDVSAKQYKDAIKKLGKMVTYRAQRPWLYLDWVFHFSQIAQFQRKLLYLLSSFRDSVINKRRNVNTSQNLIVNTETYDEFAPGKKRLALLDLLLQAEKDGVIDAKGISEEVDTFMFEGHDTSATALQFALLCLANNPEVQELAREECDRIFEGSDRRATMNDLMQMKYLECCIKETLRLYPPVFFVIRSIDEPMKLKYHRVPAGTQCFVLVYDLQRRDDQFVEPLRFNPERFMLEPTWHQFAYVPFSAGSRNCIGQKFAMMEMKLALSAILRNYKLLPVTKVDEIVLILDILLRPKDPIYVKFESRK